VKFEHYDGSKAALILTVNEKQLKSLIQNAFSLQNVADRAVLDVDGLLARVMLSVRRSIETGLPDESLLRDAAWKSLQPIVQDVLLAYADGLRRAIEQQHVTAAPDMAAYAVREATNAGAVITRGLSRPLQASVIEQVGRARVGKARFRELFYPEEKRGVDGRFIPQKKIPPVVKSMFRVVDRNVRIGILEGRTTQQIANQVVHETITRGVPGVSLRGQTSVRQIRAQAMAMSRTVVQDVARQVKEEVWQANADALEGFVYQWSSALDSRTCETCAVLDNRTWKTRRKAPTNPIHPNCRCQLLLINPEDKFWAEGKRTGQQIRREEYKEGYASKVKVNGELFYRKAVNFTGDDFGDYLKSSNLTTQTEFFGGGKFPTAKNPKGGIGYRRAQFFRKQLDKMNKDPQQILVDMLTGPANAKRFISLQ
jgi:hypothetical protein